MKLSHAIRHALLLLLTLPFFVAAGAEPKRVLLIHSLGRDFAPYNEFSRTFRTELASRSPEPVEFFEASLESARASQSTQEDALLDYLRTQFAGLRLDLIVPIGGPAVRFAQRYRQQLFPSRPLLLAATDQRHLDPASLTTNDTVVAVANNPALILESILEVLPQTTNLVVVTGNSAIEQFWLSEFRRDFRPFTNRVSMVWLNELPFPEILKRCATLPPRSAVFFPLMCVDAAGVPYFEERPLANLHAVANAPIFGFRDTQLGWGIVGGPLTGIQELSRNTAQVAVRLLHGEIPAQIRVPPATPGPSLFDWRELQRWGVSERRLPADSVVLFRQPTIWQLYRGRLIAIGLLCLAEGVLIVLLLRNAISRRKAERGLRESEERLSLAAAAADVGVWVWEVARNEIWATGILRRMFGFPATTTIRIETFLERVHPDDRSGVAQAVQQALKDRADYRSEHRILLPDGTQRWIGARGRLDRGTDARGQRMLGAAVDITERKRAEQAAHDFGGQLLRAQEEERARLAKELHDGLSQNLALLSIELELLGQRLPDAPAEINGRLKEFSGKTKDLSAEVHRISHGLHPAKLTQLGLVVALRGHCREVEAAHGIAVRFEAGDVPRELPEELGLCFYRITQEALQNVVKHSRATHADVKLGVTGEDIELTVSDNGQGFVVQAQREVESLGIVSMRERAQLVHGQVSVESSPGQGTRVRVRAALTGGKRP